MKKVRIGKIDERTKSFEQKNTLRKIQKNNEDLKQIHGYYLLDTSIPENVLLFHNGIKISLLYNVKLQYLFKKFIETYPNLNLSFIDNDDFDEDNDDWFFGLKNNKSEYIIQVYPSALNINMDYYDIVEMLLDYYFIIVNEDIHFLEIKTLDLKNLKEIKQRRV